MSPPENALWRVLRSRPEGLQFRRQHPFGPYVLDFYCKAAGLAVEVDGMAHSMGTNPAKDERRDNYLLANGVERLRIAAADVRGDLDAVLIIIVQHCISRTPPPAAPVPLPAQSRGGKSL